MLHPKYLNTGNASITKTADNSSLLIKPNAITSEMLQANAVKLDNLDIDSLRELGTKRVDIVSAGTYSPAKINNNIIAVDLRDGDVTIILPPVVDINEDSIEGHEVTIYIEINTPPYNTLTIQTAAGDDIRGSPSYQFTLPFDGVTLVAHTLGRTHWDVKNWIQDSRTDTIKYIGGSPAVTAIKTLQDLLNHTLSTGRITGGEITVNGDGTINVASAEWKLRSVASISSDCRVYSIPAVSNITVPEDTRAFLYVSYNNGSPVINIGTNPNIVNGQTECIQDFLYRRGNTVNITSIGDYSSDFMGSYNKRESEFRGLKREQGVMIGGVTGTYQFTLTAGVIYNGVTRFNTPALTSLSSTFTYWRRSGSSWVTTNNSTIINKDQWDDNGTLTNTSNNRFYNHWVFLLVGSVNSLHVVLPQVQYNSLAEAQTGVLTQAPPFLGTFGAGILVGVITTRPNASQIEDIRSPFSDIFQSSTPLSHNNLANLNQGDFMHVTAAQHTTINQGVSGSFTTTDGKTITITNGIVTSIT
jgi:hypothetical protein